MVCFCAYRQLMQCDALDETIYSRIDPSDALVLGINPGGDPGTWTEDMLASRSFYENWEHEYVDCKYAI